MKPADIEAAALRLAQGGLVAFPTETVYGLGARADDDAAVGGIFRAKGRPADHPLIVHVPDEAAAAGFAASLSDAARGLMRAFWPGPVTVIVKRRPGVAAACAGGQDSIGLRCPAHPMAQALLRAAAERGVPGVAAPSANRFGRVSPTTAQHVQGEFGPDLLVLDGGACPVGIESAIVDCSTVEPVLLRPGVLTRGQLESAAGRPLGQPHAHSPRASGTLASHYAPRARVRLMSPSAWTGGSPLPMGVALYSMTEPAAASASGEPALWRRMPSQAADAARDLFAGLRDLDDQVGARGGGEIWVQEPPEGPEWDGVRDRLQRAAA